MDIMKIIDLLISGGGLVLGVTYIIGGLIVNLHLSIYGVTQYQILRVKYFVVGLTYLINFIAVLALTAIPAFWIISFSSVVQQSFFILSLLASIALLWLWGRPPNINNILFSWRLWVIAGAIASIFPLAVFIKLIFIMMVNASIDITFAVFLAQAFLIGIVSFVGQTYYYARHLYGRSNPIFGSIDPIGMGIPVQVQLTGLENEISILENLGVPMKSSKITGELLLLDETDKNYILGIANDGQIKTVEVFKDIVKAIRYN